MSLQNFRNTILTGCPYSLFTADTSGSPSLGMLVRHIRECTEGYLSTFESYQALSKKVGVPGAMSSEELRQVGHPPPLSWVLNYGNPLFLMCVHLSFYLAALLVSPQPSNSLWPGRRSRLSYSTRNFSWNCTCVSGRGLWMHSHFP